MPSMLTLLVLLAVAALDETLGLYAVSAVLVWKLLWYAVGRARVL